MYTVLVIPAEIVARAHVLWLDCQDCQALVDRQDRATLPSRVKLMTCFLTWPGLEIYCVDTRVDLGDGPVTRWQSWPTASRWEL
jgi:hypothetical protein